MDMLFERQNYLYHNQQDGSFQDVTPLPWREQPRPTMGAAYADYDRDGWVDFIVTEWNEGFTLYRNQGQEGTGHHWLTVQLTGGQGVNRNAIGGPRHGADGGRPGTDAGSAQWFQPGCRQRTGPAFRSGLCPAGPT